MTCINVILHSNRHEFWIHPISYVQTEDGLYAHGPIYWLSKKDRTIFIGASWPTEPFEKLTMKFEGRYKYVKAYHLHFRNDFIINKNEDHYVIRSLM